MAGSVKVKAGQTLLDIAMQTQGTVAAVFELAALNGIGITDDLQTGQQLTTGDVMVAEVADYFRKYGATGILPASAATIAPGGTDINPGGIGYMGIGINFKVS